MWREEEVGFAFRRLAIIDLDERSNQPLHLGSLHMVFNGEIYNYVELREQLRGLGHDFHTEGDGEVLLHAWQQWGRARSTGSTGCTRSRMWDGERKRLTVAVDPFAEKPLMYRRLGEGLAFASDVRALQAAPIRRSGSPDETTVREYVALGTMPQLPQTFFGDVRRLPPRTWPGGSGERGRAALLLASAAASAVPRTRRAPAARAARAAGRLGRGCGCAATFPSARR